MSWTDDRVEVLTKMWTDGRSAAEIAKELGGITRNAVIGKAHRLGLSGRASPIKKKKVEKTTVKAKKATVTKKASKKVVKTSKKVEDKAVSAEQQKLVTKAIKEAAAETAPSNDGTGVGLMDLTERVCKWPIGDPQHPDFHFCGKSSPQGVPYCPEHAGMAYQAPRKQNAGRSKKGEIKIVSDTNDTSSKDSKKSDTTDKKSKKSKKAS